MDYSALVNSNFARFGEVMHSSLTRQLHNERTAMTLDSDDEGKKTVRFDTIPGKPVVDISWLPAMSKVYNISPNLRDYVIKPVPIVRIGFPNRNMDGFHISDMLQYIHATRGQSFRSFVGAPCFKNHDNKDYTKALGVHLDSVITMMEFQGRVTPFIVILVAYDRSKDKDLVQKMLSGKATGHSMGAWVKKARCSICGAVGQYNYCEHSRKKGKTFPVRNGPPKLAFDWCGVGPRYKGWRGGAGSVPSPGSLQDHENGVVFFESSVTAEFDPKENPAGTQADFAAKGNFFYQR